MYERKGMLLCVALLSGLISVIRTNFFEDDHDPDVVSIVFTVVFLISFGCYIWVTRDEERGGGGGGDGGF